MAANGTRAHIYGLTHPFAPRSPTPRSPTPTPKIRPAAPTVQAPVNFKPTVTHYDPSRIIDPDKLRVVEDLRQNGSERGETQSGDSGTLGPGSSPGAFVRTEGEATTPPPVAKKDNSLLWLAAIAAFVLYGG